jgi:integrase
MSAGGTDTWVVPPSRFLDLDEIGRPRAALRRRAFGSRAWKPARMREWFVVELALHTGLRVGEIAALRCGDIQPALPLPYVPVRRGKGGRPRIVRLGASFLPIIADYLERTDGSPVLFPAQFDDLAALREPAPVLRAIRHAGYRVRALHLAPSLAIGPDGSPREICEVDAIELERIF